MATVYLAHDLRHERKVALKVLRPELAAVIGAERFLAEIRTTANLQHPHVLPLFDSGVADSFLYYVMPFVDGISLRERLAREKQLPLAEAVRIASEIAGALDYAHRHGIIHRDIKPENILLHDGSALVADFGIALAASKAGTRMTETGMSLGTPQYMSPEQAMGDRDIDARSDVYALGCVTYEMLTGEPPFSGPTAQAIVAKVLSTEPVAIETLRPTVPPQVADAVRTALQKLPADRFTSARAFAEALSSSSSIEAATRDRIDARAGRRVPGAALVALVAAAALLAGAAGAALLLRDRGPAAGPLRLQLRLPSGQEFGDTPFPSVAATPDGSGVVYVGSAGDVPTRLWLRRWDRLQARGLALPEGEGCCVAFSPSGDSLAFLATPRRLTVVPLAGGLPAALSDSGLSAISDWGGGLDWGSDGWLYVSGSGGLLRVDPRDGSRQLVARHDSARGDLIFLWPHLLPGARGALVTVADRAAPSDPGRASIGVADLETGRVDLILQGVRAVYAPTGHLIVVRADGVLSAVPFDARALRPTGPPRELADTVAIRTGHAAPGVVDLAITPTGALVYVAGGQGSVRPVWVDRSGSWDPVADRAGDDASQGVTLSPDGERMVLAVGGPDGALHLWMQPADGGSRVRLTFDGVLNMRPEWRPGTRSVSFVAIGGSGVESSPNSLLLERDAGGQGAARPLATGDPRSVGGHTWSPDGRWLIFRTDDQESGSGDILAVRPEVDTSPRPLVATPAEELNPSVSPDGRWLAYTSNESGRREVYVRPFPNTADARYQVSTAGGVSPMWNPAGGELFFLDASQNMISVPVLPGSAFRTGEPRILFSAAAFVTNPYHPQYDVTPDGERFVMSRVETGTDLGLVVVFNFLEELKRRMASKESP